MIKWVILVNCYNTVVSTVANISISFAQFCHISILNEKENNWLNYTKLLDPSSIHCHFLVAGRATKWIEYKIACLFLFISYEYKYWSKVFLYKWNM